jgi:acetone carboxylase gamma subunit
LVSGRQCGLGTPATRTEIIKKLTYAGTKTNPKEPLVHEEKKGKSKVLIPTEKGIKLIELVPVETLKSPELTGIWESKLEQIRKGNYSRSTFMEEVRDYLTSMTSTIKTTAESRGLMNTRSNTTSRPPAKEINEKCPRCGAKLALKSWEGKYYVTCTKDKKSGEPCYFRFDTDSEGNPLYICTQCKGRVTTTKTGKKICADCESWQNDDSETKPHSPAKEIKEKCPRCGAKLALKSWERKHYITCTKDKKSGEPCYFRFDTDSEGNPLYVCTQCKGRVTTTKTGKKICADCESWQNDDNAQKSENSESSKSKEICPKCKKGFLTQRSGQYGPFKSCSDKNCGLLYSTDEDGNPKNGTCPNCKGPCKKSKDGKIHCLACGLWVKSKT